MLGAGPFFLIDPISFDEVDSSGELAVFEHSAAFGQWGSVCIELQQIARVLPQRAADLLSPGLLPVVNHVAYVSDAPDADSAELSAAGHEMFLHAKFGGVEVWFHDARAVLGQAIEIHRYSAALEASFARIAAASRDWDGTELLRPMGDTP